VELGVQRAGGQRRHDGPWGTSDNRASLRLLQQCFYLQLCSTEPLRMVIHIQTGLTHETHGLGSPPWSSTWSSPDRCDSFAAPG
jgi:hypothetical protein